MRCLLLTVLTILISSTSVEARPKHWYKDPKWLLGEFLSAAAIGADAYSTVLRTNREIEGNHLLGPNPSRGKVIGVASLSMGLQTFYYAECWHITKGEDDQSKFWNFIGYTGVPVSVVSIYGLKGAIHNFQLEFPKVPTMTVKDKMVKK
jgi:hypothetical protein